MPSDACFRSRFRTARCIAACVCSCPALLGSSPTWEPAPGVNGTVRAFANDPTTGAVYAGGSFTKNAAGDPVLRVGVLRDGAWEPLADGLNNPVFALCFFDSGSGHALYAGGAFGATGDSLAAGLARWTGVEWVGVGGGVHGGPTPGVTSLLSVDLPTVSGLVVGGTFTSAGALPASNIAVWDGAAWSALGAGLNGAVTSLGVFENELYAAGSFTLPGTDLLGGIARWTGTGWSDAGGGLNGAAHAMAVADVNGSPALIVAGAFTSAGRGTANRVASWDGAAWSALGTGFNGDVYTLATAGSGAAQRVHAGGFFGLADGSAAFSFATWDGSGWSPVGAGLRNGGSLGTMHAMTHDRAGLLLVGGDFVRANNQAVLRVAAVRCTRAPAVPADLNSDGTVDGIDLVQLLGAWGPCPLCKADLNKDGTVDGIDLVQLLGAWG